MHEEWRVTNMQHISLCHTHEHCTFDSKTIDAAKSKRQKQTREP